MPTPFLGLWFQSFVEEYICVVVSHQVCAYLLQKPQVLMWHFLHALARWPLIPSNPSSSVYASCLCPTLLYPVLTCKTRSGHQLTHSGKSKDLLSLLFPKAPLSSQNRTVPDMHRTPRNSAWRVILICLSLGLWYLPVTGTFFWFTQSCLVPGKCLMVICWTNGKVLLFTIRVGWDCET